MIIGVPAEVKDHEYRVSVTPDGVAELAAHGHDVLVQSGAGAGAGFADDEYAAARAQVLANASQVWGRADLVVKVKEPVAQEYGYLRPGLTLFTYLHLGGNRELTLQLMDCNVTALAYETIEDNAGRLPLLAPMSEIAGRMAAQVGASYLERALGGCGVLIGGALGVDAARVVVIGAGVVGSSAARVAAGMDADVVIIDRDADRLRSAEAVIGTRVRTALSTSTTIANHVRDAHVVIGAALQPGARAPHLVTEGMVGTMRSGSVIVDVSIDQGGCVETSRMTTHSEPTFRHHDVIHYCVGNMPGAVPWTSTQALTNATLPYLLAVADMGVEEAVRTGKGIASGCNVWDGALTNEAVAEAHDLPATPLEAVSTA